MWSHNLSLLTSALLQICPNAEIQIDDKYMREPVYLHSSAGSISKPVIQKQLGGGLLLSVALPGTEQNKALVRALDSVATSYIRTSHQQVTSGPDLSQNRLLMDYLLRIDASENVTNILLLARDIGIDLSMYRFICLLDYSNLLQQPSFQAENLLSVLQNHFTMEFPHSAQLLSLEYNSRQYVFCVPDPQREVSSRAFLPPLLNGLNKRLESLFGQPCHIGVGFCVKQPGDYLEALSAAQVALRFGASQTRERISYIEDYLLDYDIENIVTLQIHSYLAPYLQKLKEDPTLCDTIQALLSSDLDYLEAANKLYMHKNTFLKRMHAMKDRLDMDPIRSDSDCILLAILLQYIKSGRTF